MSPVATARLGGGSGRSWDAPWLLLSWPARAAELMPRQAARLHPPCWPAVTVALPAELPHHADPGLGGLYLRARVPLDGDVEPMPVASGVGAGDLVAIQNSGGVVAGVPAVRVVVSGRCHHRAAWPADTFGRSRMCHLCTAAGTVRSPWPRLSGKTDGMRSGRPRPAPAARSAFAGFRFPRRHRPGVRCYLRYGLSTETSRNCSLSAASRSTMSPSTGGCFASPACSPRRPGRPACRWRSLAGRRETSVKVGKLNN
jgi:hypothetical protein